MARLLILAALLALALGRSLAAQDLSGLARLDPGASGVADAGAGVEVALALSQPVPWRLFTLDAPRRLVLDFRTVDWAGAGAGLLEPGRATGLALGTAGGWSRLVLDLGEPLAVSEAAMRVDEGDGTARLRVVLAPTDAAAFAAAAVPAPPEAGPAGPRPGATSAPDDRFVVALDPGHGGIDPGAEREGLREAHLMLALGLELSEALARAGAAPVLTRAEDVFVPLADRMTLARAAGADVLVSLHADALEADAARGASVYVLSDEAADGASARMVERHERGDLLAGLDLGDQDDAVATALMDLARAETGPASARLAQAVVAGLEGAGASVNGHALKSAPLAVLHAADFPSVLVEVGFLSDEGDRARLSTPEGRAPVVAGLVAALLAWEADEAARAGLRLR